MNFFRGLLIATGLSFILWAVAISVAIADHRGATLEPGDVVAATLVCINMQTTAALWHEIVKNPTEENLPPPLSEAVPKFCSGQFAGFPMRIAKVLAVAPVNVDGGSEDFYLVQYAPIKGHVMFGTLFQSRILEKGSAHYDRRTHRR
jgi:hypothetical protein